MLRRQVPSLIAILSLGFCFCSTAFAQESEETIDQAVDEAVEETDETIDHMEGLFEREPVVYQITLPRFWTIITPAFALNAFFDMHPNHWEEPKTNFAFGTEFIIRRIDEYDLVFSLDWADLRTGDNFWLESDEQIIDTDWGDNDLSILTVDVAINWLAKIDDYWDFYYGVGLGVGLILGDFLKQDIDPACMEAGGVNPFDSTETGIIEAHCLDANGNPLLKPGAAVEEEDNIPPLIPALSFNIGSRWIIDDDWAIQLELGFKNIYFYTGIEVGYIFE